jgi:para-nitrobenzyl esterase
MDPIVTTAAGRVRGRRSGRVTAFLGVPYASAPRFAPPAAPRPWRGVRDATRIGPAAPQPPSRLEHVIGPIHRPQSEEDCLSVNVWTPDPSGRRPVLVFVHGGGFTAGSGGHDGYHGDGLAEAGDLVVVTLNYRLGALGFLYLAGSGRSRRRRRHLDRCGLRR